ncbi:MAG: hypothetical protein A2Y50_03280 [Pseudomonadales bacterium RIFCSPLOWO2_12_59_9]|nr:MAG: hypothetical protein A2Y50_03280 [Pseudomonadales bacterium RIFCSPLOWO2_12_59_9]
MKLSSPLRTFGLFTLLSLVGVAQAHAEPVTTSSTPQQVAESGSERATERANKLRAEQAQKMAESGSERSPQRGRKLIEKPQQQVAESGGERSHKRATRTGKLRDEQAPIIAEGGSDRLQLWHQQRSV